MTGAAARREGLWLLAALALLWGVNWPAMKLAVAETGPWTFRAICLYVGAAGLFAVGYLRGLDLRLPRGRFLALAAASFLNITICVCVSGFHRKLVHHSSVQRQHSFVSRGFALALIDYRSDFHRP